MTPFITVNSCISALRARDYSALCTQNWLRIRELLAWPAGTTAPVKGQRLEASSPQRGDGRPTPWLAPAPVVRGAAGTLTRQ